jgi:hypothetical protein
VECASDPAATTLSLAPDECQEDQEDAADDQPAQRMDPVNAADSEPGAEENQGVGGVAIDCSCRR